MIGRNGSDMITVKDVPAEAFINAYAEHLKKTQKVTPIKDANILKTGYSQELTPENEDWFFVRSAAIARTLYLRPERGVGHLRHVFGKRHKPGHKKRFHAVASGKVIRFAIQQLEKANILMAYNDKRNKNFQGEQDETKYPRIVTSEGHQDMNTVAKNVYNSLYKQQ